MTLDDLVRLLNRGSSIRIVHVPAVVARILAYLGLRLPAPLIDVMLHDSLSDHPTAAAVFGLHMTHLSEVWTKPAEGSGGPTRGAVGNQPLQLEVCGELTFANAWLHQREEKSL